jgi:NAD(P)-dependent dehydrogenase (short-subunit alcohol dehydrogenase family)
MTAGKLADKKILVCGGATGIGAATALCAGREGADVIVHYHLREAQARAVCAQVRDAGGHAAIAQADLTDPQAVAALLDGLGPIDGFVHSVSAPIAVEPLSSVEWPAFQLQWEATVKSAFLLVKALLAREVVPSAGVFVSSAVTSGVPPRDWPSYVTAKYGLLGFVRSIAQDAAGRGLRLNLVSPGMTETPLTAVFDARRRELTGRATPLKRLGTVDEAAAAIVFLLSNESAYIVGADLPVAGGTVL